MPTKPPALTDPALLEILNCFKPPPPGDFGYRYRTLEMAEMVDGLHRSPELREHIRRFKPFSGRTGQTMRTAQGLCRVIEFLLAAREALP